MPVFPFLILDGRASAETAEERKGVQTPSVPRFDVDHALNGVATLKRFVCAAFTTSSTQKGMTFVPLLS
jgi:hypothetical protein